MNEEMKNLEMVLIKSYAYGYYSGAENIQYIAIPKSVADKFGCEPSLFVFELDGKHSEEEAEITSQIMTLEELMEMDLDLYQSNTLPESYYYEVEEEIEDLCECVFGDEKIQCKYCDLLDDDLEDLFEKTLKILTNKNTEEIILDQDTTINEKVYPKGSKIKIKYQAETLNTKQEEIIKRIMNLDKKVKNL